MKDFETGFYSSQSYVCLYARDTKLFMSLDTKFVSFISDLTPEEYHIPALIDGDVLEKCGYFSSFPQHLTPVSYIYSFADFMLRIMSL